MMKKTIMLLIAAVMPAVAAWCAVGDKFTEEVPLGDKTIMMTFRITSEGGNKTCQVCMTVGVVTDFAGNLVIPEEINGYTVTSIGEYAFYNYTNLTSITIPESVESIAFCAFQNCTSLTSITIPEGVTNIESDVFWGCSSLNSVTILGYMIGIRDNAFYGCNALEYIDMSKAEIVDFSRADTGIPTGTLIFISESKAGDFADDKYIVSVDGDGTGTINEITLTEGKNFSTPYIINANTINNNRTFTPSETNAYTLCLPYGLTVPESMIAYEPGYEDGEGNLVFTEVESGELKAYTPYLVTVSGEDVSLNATNATIGKTPAEPEAVTVGGYNLYGTTRKVDNATAAGMGAYILQATNKWKPVSTTNTAAYVMPCRAYLIPSPEVSGAKEINTVFDNETTGIGAIKTVDSNGTTRMYDLGGRRIEGNTKGIYIMNGKKYVSPVK